MFMKINICETCGSVSQGESGPCADCGQSVSPPGEIRRLPHEVVLSFLEHAEELLSSSPLRQVVLSVVAGSFIAFGAVLSVALTTDVESIGLSRLLLGLGFSAGFVLVVLSGSALFTEINVLLPEMFLSRPRDLCRRFWRFWHLWPPRSATPEPEIGKSAGASAPGKASDPARTD